MNLQLLQDLLTSALESALPRFILERADQSFRLDQTEKLTTLMVMFTPVSRDRDCNVRCVTVRLEVSSEQRDTTANQSSPDSSETTSPSVIDSVLRDKPIASSGLNESETP